MKLLKGSPWSKRDDAADRGSAIHAAVAAYLSLYRSRRAIRKKRPPGKVAGPIPPRLGCDLLEAEVGYVGALPGMLDRNRDDVALGVEIKERVFIEVSRFSDVGAPELNIQRVSLLEVPNLHGLNPRSKKEL